MLVFVFKIWLLHRSLILLNRLPEIETMKAIPPEPVFGIPVGFLCGAETVCDNCFLPKV